MEMANYDDSVEKSSSFSSDYSDESSDEVILSSNQGDQAATVVQTFKGRRRVVQVKSGKQEPIVLNLGLTQHLNAEAMVIRISPDKSVYAVGMANGDIRLFQLSDVTSKDFFMRLKANTETLPCTDIRFSISDNHYTGLSKFHLLASYASGYVRLWHYTSLSLKTSLLCEWEEKVEYDPSTRVTLKDSHNQILCLSISLDNRRFVTGGTDTYIRVYEMASRTAGNLLRPSIRTDMATGHTTRVTALAYHPRGERDPLYQHIFLSASWDDSIRIWDDQKAVSLWCYFGPHVAGNDGLDIDPVRNLILTCSWRREHTIVQLWKFADFLVDLSEVKSEREIEEYSHPVAQFVYEPNKKMSQGYVAQFDPSYHHIVFAGSNENLLKVLDIVNSTVLAEIHHLEYGVYSAAIFLDSNLKNSLRVIFTNGKSVQIGRIGAARPRELCYKPTNH